MNNIWADIEEFTQVNKGRGIRSNHYSITILSREIRFLSRLSYDIKFKYLNNGYNWVKLYYSNQNQAIIIKFVNEKTENSLKLTQIRNHRGYTVSVIAFLKYYNISARGQFKVLDVNLPTLNQCYVIYI